MQGCSSSNLPHCGMNRENKTMKRLLLITAVLCAGLLFTACGGQKAKMQEKRQEVSQETDACMNLARPGCEASAEKACEGKSGLARDACIKASKEACMAAALKQC